MTHSHSRQCFNIAPRLGWILTNTSTTLHSDDSLAVKHRLIPMLQSHSLDNLEDGCRQRNRDQEQRPDLLWLSPFRNGMKIIASVSKNAGIADSLEMDRIIIGQKRTNLLQPPVLRQETGRDRQGAPSWCFAHSNSPRPITSTTSFINHHRFYPYQRSTTLRFHHL